MHAEEKTEFASPPSKEQISNLNTQMDEVKKEEPVEEDIGLAKKLKNIKGELKIVIPNVGGNKPIDNIGLVSNSRSMAFSKVLPSNEGPESLEIFPQSSNFLLSQSKSK